jgi:hypothetical protein
VRHTSAAKLSFTFCCQGFDSFWTLQGADQLQDWTLECSHESSRQQAAGDSHTHQICENLITNFPEYFLTNSDDHSTLPSHCACVGLSQPSQSCAPAVDQPVQGVTQSSEKKPSLTKVIGTLKCAIEVSAQAIHNMSRNNQAPTARQVPATAVVLCLAT